MSPPDLSWNVLIWRYVQFCTNFILWNFSFTSICKALLKPFLWLTIIWENCYVQMVCNSLTVIVSNDHYDDYRIIIRFWNIINWSDTDHKPFHKIYLSCVFLFETICEQKIFELTFIIHRNNIKKHTAITILWSVKITLS